MNVQKKNSRKSSTKSDERWEEGRKQGVIIGLVDIDDRTRNGGDNLSDEDFRVKWNLPCVCVRKSKVIKCRWEKNGGVK